MTEDLHERLATIRAEVETLAAPVDTLREGLKRLETAIEKAIEQGVEGLPKPTVPPSAHRAAHRPGRAPKIDSDPELQAFIRARINRLTFVEIATDIASHFPEPRRVGKSAIWDWWKRQK